MDRDAQGPEATGTATTRTKRLRRMLGRIMARLDAARERPLVAVGGVVGLLSFTIGLGVLWSLILAPKIVKKFDDQFAPVLAHLDAGDFELARNGASNLRKQDWTFEELGGPVYVIGVVTARDADEHWDPLEQRNLYLIASRYFEEASDRGIPKGREAALTRFLATTMFRGGRIQESIPLLEKSLEAPDSRSAELHLLSTLANLRQAEPNYQKARHHVDQYLASDGLEPEEMMQGLVLRGETLLKLGEVDEAQKTLSDLFVILRPIMGSGNILERTAQPKIAPKELAQWRAVAAEALVMESQIGLESVRELEAADASADVITQAMEAIAERLVLAKERHLDSAPSNLLLARLLRKMGKDDEALVEFVQVRRKYFAEDEGFAASIQEAELLLSRARPTDALQALLRVVPEIRSPDTFQNRWITGDELRTRLRVIYIDFVEASRFDEAVSVTDLAKTIFSEAESTEMRADAQLGGGKLRIREAELLPSNFEQLKKDACLEFRAAGRSYEKLGELRYAAREHTDYLWKSADAYHNGNDYRSVVRVMRRYLREESRNRRPHALTMLGESLLAQGEDEAALRTLADAISQYPTHPITYRARLASARLHLDRKELKIAEQLLNDNLENGVLTPRSLDWQESLFLLGRAFFIEGMDLDRTSREVGIDSSDPARQKEGLKQLELADRAFERAVRKLNEFVLRAPTERFAVDARFMLAESQRFRSKLPRRKLQTETIETIRTNLLSERRAQLEEARRGYDSIVAELNRKQDISQLTSEHNSILRNCYFLGADALFQLGEFEAAIAAYSSATNRYQFEPASLDAYLQIAAAYRRLNNVNKARGSLEQAKVVLAKMPVDLPYEATSRYSRKQWEQHLQ
jgi:tetratricopeptide (TPR) repeat protein